MGSWVPAVGSEGRSGLAGCDLGSLEPGPLKAKAAVQGWACSARSYSAHVWPHVLNPVSHTA